MESKYINNFEKYEQELKSKNSRLFNDEEILKTGLSKDKVEDFKKFALMLLIDKDLE